MPTRPNRTTRSRSRPSISQKFADDPSESSKRRIATEEPALVRGVHSAFPRSCLMLSTFPVDGFCTFCDAPLDGSVEHILLSAVGGRRTSRRVDCRKHNHDLGSTIDRVLAQQLAPLCNLFDIRTGRNEAAPQIKGAPTADGAQVDLTPGGRLRARTQFKEQVVSPGVHEVTITAASRETLRAHVETYAKRRPGPIDLSTVSVQEVTQVAVPVQLSIEIGGEASCRAVAKASLLHLAATVGTGTTRSPEFAAVRGFVLDGGDAESFVKLDSVTPVAWPESFSRFSARAHRMATYSDGAAGVSVGIVEFFGTVRFSVLLSPTWSGPTVAVYYAVDPVTGAHDEVQAAESAPLVEASFRALTARDGTPNYDRLLQMLAVRRSEIALSDEVRDVLAEADTQQLTREELALKVSQRFQAGGSVPLVKALDPAEFLRGEAPGGAKATPPRRKRRGR